MTTIWSNKILVASKSESSIRTSFFRGMIWVSFSWTQFPNESFTKYVSVWWTKFLCTYIAWSNVNFPSNQSDFRVTVLSIYFSNFSSNAVLQSVKITKFSTHDLWTKISWKQLLSFCWKLISRNIFQSKKNILNEWRVVVLKQIKKGLLKESEFLGNYPLPHDLHWWCTHTIHD